MRWNYTIPATVGPLESLDLGRTHRQTHRRDHRDVAPTRDVPPEEDPALEMYRLAVPEERGGGGRRKERKSEREKEGNKIR